MSFLIQDLLKVRIKQLKRIARNIGPVEFHIWERALETMGQKHTHLYHEVHKKSPQLGDDRARVCAKGDSADTLSDHLLAIHRRDTSKCNRRQCISSETGTLPSTKEKGDERQSGCKKEITSDSTLTLPLVGSWEFECDDDEYIKFLELFLTYMLEKDLINNEDACVPYLTTFSKQLQNLELNSFPFNGHTPGKRHHSHKKNADNVCIFGRNSYEFNEMSYTFQKEGPSPNMAWSARSSLTTPGSSEDHTDIIVDGVCHSSEANKSKEIGLFGLRQNGMSTPCFTKDTQQIPVRQMSLSVISQSPCAPGFSTPTTAKSEMIICHAALPKDIGPALSELTPELQAQFKLIRRLLEWVIRWANRRLLCEPTNGGGQHGYSTVIRVKSSAPAILSALWLLEKRYSPTNLVDKHAHLEVPQSDDVVTQVLYSKPRINIKKERTADSGIHGSTKTPITLFDKEDCEVHGPEGCV
ncbi:ciliogenesis and planar polarity effector 1-like [Erpetoichthys calabaricus]|uniref:ciliogenesis and planar polarity effector 1-like n=1 Tax=Erpetoichthys calabaricus TaxID=27687 RepID=UPI002234DE48|nr:ciliogenesis and planar polarity effector 1-like [Erpetoichthys calabaricus]